MKILIVGGSSSGLFLALDLKRKNPKLEVILLEKNNALAKKMYATGNGRCNLGNLNIKKESYNNKETFDIYKKFPVEEEIKYFTELGFKLTRQNDLIYPYFYSAKQFVDYLIELIEKANIKVYLNERIKDYSIFGNKIIVNSTNEKFLVDKLVFASGGKSTPNLGSDGSVFSLLKEHKYKITHLYPGLSPFKVKEKVSLLENERVKAKVTLVIEKDKVYEEEGEVLFKKDGLSGIVSFNINSIILRNSYKNASIYLDLFPLENKATLLSEFKKFNSLYGTSFLDGYFNKKMKEYILTNSKVKSLHKFSVEELKTLVNFVKEMPFRYLSSYDFDSSQVTIGGVPYSYLNKDLSSNIEKNVYFIGEILDSDGLCGGFNLMFAFASAKVVSNAINQTL